MLLCTLALGFAFVGISTYVTSKDELPTGTALMTTVAGRDLPLIDQAIVTKTEFALFALG